MDSGANLAARFAGAERTQSELERIINLPVLDPEWVAPDLSHMFRRPGGTMTLRPIQSKVVYYSLVYGGLLAAIGVGHGKTLISLVLCTALKAERPILLIPASMRDDLNRQWALYAPHWNLPRNLAGRIFSYDFLSDPKSTALLTNLRPDLIVCDEFQNLKDPKSVRTRRFERYLKLHPEVKLVVMTGTPTAKSVKEYAHGAKYALKGNSPLPLKYGELEVFSRALDVSKRPPDSRAVHDLMPLIQRFHPGPVDLAFLDGSEAREAYFRRLTSCPGVVATRELSCDASIHIAQLRPEVPANLADWIRYVARTWVSPQGDILEDALAVSRVMRQLSGGFFYRWVWGPSGPDREWLETRADWHKSLRAWLPRSGPGLDSPALVAMAAKNRPRDLPADLVDSYRRWVPQSHKSEPPTETVWIDPFLVNHAIAYAKSRPDPVLIWFENDAIGSAIAQAGGFPFLPGGPASNGFLADVSAGARPSQTVTLSIDAHGTGKNLQPYRENLIVEPPANGATWDQLLGRSHRQNQKAERIDAAVYVHTDTFEGAFKSAREGANYIQQTWGTPQKLCFARIDD